MDPSDRRIIIKIKINNKNEMKKAYHLFSSCNDNVMNEEEKKRNMDIFPYLAWPYLSFVRIFHLFLFSLLSVTFLFHPLIPLASIWHGRD